MGWTVFYKAQNLKLKLKIVPIFVAFFRGAICGAPLISGNSSFLWCVCCVLLCAAAGCLCCALFLSERAAGSRPWVTIQNCPAWGCATRDACGQGRPITQRARCCLVGFDLGCWCLCVNFFSYGAGPFGTRTPRLFGNSRFCQTLAPVAHRFSTGGPQQGAGRIYHAAVLLYD